LKELDNTIKVLKSYELPKYQFLWGIDINMTTKNTVVTFIGTTFTALLTKLMNVLKSKVKEVTEEYI
jgi:hypothetical protein